MKQTLDLTVLLTVFKRRHLGTQLKAIESQSVKPRHIVVFQNENHRKVSWRKLVQRGHSYVFNSANTGYFGRFAYLLNSDTEYVAILDDDIVPGPNCLANYFNQAVQLNGIIGGNGRIARTNKFIDELHQPPDVGIRPHATLVDFVGHMWLFRTDLLRDMFSVSPHTLHTGEDMHLCFSAKLKSGIPSFAAKQEDLMESCDVRLNQLASDDLASYRSTPKTLREDVERYFLKLGLNFISPDDQRKLLP